MLVLELEAYGQPVTPDSSRSNKSTPGCTTDRERTGGGQGAEWGITAQVIGLDTGTGSGTQTRTGFKQEVKTCKIGRSQHQSCMDGQRTDKNGDEDTGEQVRSTVKKGHGCVQNSR